MLVQAAALAAPPQNPIDTLVFPPRETVIRLYTDCTEARWPWDTAEAFVPKTPEEISSGVARRRALETGWRAWYAARADDSLPFTAPDAWAYPLGVRGRLVDNYLSPRAGGPHDALDLFVTREGVPVRSPVDGLVIAAGDDWLGGWRRHGGFHYEGGGLSRRAGNGVIVFDAGSGAYLYFAHLHRGVLVHAGDVVRRGQQLGRVGHTGNAATPGHGHHLHLAYKLPGTACGVDGVLVSQDPYALLRAARSRRRR